MVGPNLTAADVGPLTHRLRDALRRDPGARAVCDVAAVAAPSLETISALARLQVRARALGAPLGLVNVPLGLVELLELTGLDGTMLPPAGAQRPGAVASSSDIGRPNSGNSASVSRNAVNSAIWPPENSST